MNGAGAAFVFRVMHTGTVDSNAISLEVWLNERIPVIQDIEIIGSHPDASGIEDGTESGGYYRYALVYDQEGFGGVSRTAFLKAVSAEGVPFSSYIRNGFHREPWVDHILGLKGYQTMYSPERLEEYKQSMEMPNCDAVTDETHFSLWGSGILLGSRKEMQGIVDAVTKVYENRDQLKDL